MICTYSAKKKTPYILPYTDKDLKAKTKGLVGPAIMVPLILIRPPSESSDMLYEDVWEKCDNKKCCKKSLWICKQIKSFEIYYT